MNPEAAEKAAQAHEKASRKAGSLAMRAQRLQYLTGLGDYPSGVQLSQKFKNKTANGSTGAADLLREYADELQRKADLFRQAAQGYQAQEERISGDLNRVEKGKE